MKVIIIGGVAGGASAAARIRRLDENAQIVILERSGYISYANCGLPYYVGGVIGEKGALSVQTPEGFRRRFRVDVRVRHEAVAIDTQAKTVTVRDLEADTEYVEQYDKLLLSPGAQPVRPAIPGIDSSKIFTLRTVEDTLRIREYLDANPVRSALVVGGGFIGLEMAENLRAQGLDVTVAEAADHLMPQLDADMACYVHAELRAHGVNLCLAATVTGFREADGRIIAETAQGDLVSDLVLLSVGVRPESELAKAAGLALGVKGSIAVNERMETSAPDVYAVGDAVQVQHFITGENTLVPLAGPANKQGRIAADNICGLDSRYRGSQGTSVLKLFERTVASTGLNETAARAQGFDCESIILSPAAHATYYPGGKVLTMKVTFEQGSERLLGAQIVGYAGVDKRIDVIATAIRAGMKGSGLAELELAYAPPFSSAKDPVNMAGFMIENIASGKVKQFRIEDIPALPRDGSVFLLDSRTPAEYARGCAEGFVNIPLDEIRARMGEIPRVPVYVMCQSGLRSYLACRILAQNGYDCYNFTGGYGFYRTVTAETLAAQEAYPCGMEKVAK